MCLVKLDGQLTMMGARPGANEESRKMTDGQNGGTAQPFWWTGDGCRLWREKEDGAKGTS